MTDPTPNPDPLAEPLALINALLDDRLDAEGARRLEELVLTRPDVRRLYVRYLHQECVVLPHRGLFGASVELSGQEAKDGLLRTDSMRLPAITATGSESSGLRLTSQVSPKQRLQRGGPWRTFSRI